MSPTSDRTDLKHFSGLRSRFLKVSALGVIVFLILLFLFFQFTVENNRRSIATRYADNIARSLEQRDNLVFDTEPGDLVSVSRGGNFVWKKENYSGKKITGRYKDLIVEVRYLKNSKEQYLFSLVVFLLIGLGIVFAPYAWFGFAVMSPLRAIRLAAVRAAGGDFTLPIEGYKADEFGEVSKSFNEMFHALADYQSKLERRLKELEDTNSSLQSTQISLVRSEKLASVGQLAAGIAHEIGNPLAAVSGYIELMEDGSLDEGESADALRRVSGQLERIRVIIGGLLDYSRQDGAIPKPTSLQACLDQAIELVKAIPKSRDVKFEYADTIDANLVHAVPAQVVQILVNLILNAVDACGAQEQKTLRFGIDERNGFSNFWISDNGPGISDRHLEKIFDPFFTTKEPGEGTGLGLAIVHQMMTAMGGDIFVESDDKGACFTLIFPLHNSEID